MRIINPYSNRCRIANPTQRQSREHPQGRKSDEEPQGRNILEDRLFKLCRVATMSAQLIRHNSMGWIAAEALKKLSFSQN